MTFLSALYRFPISVILRPTPVPVPVLFPIVPFPDPGFLIFQTPILRAHVCKNRATGDHGQKSNFAHILSIHTY